MSDKKINDLLKELEESGAQVVDVEGKESESIETLKNNSNIASSIADSLGADPQSFGAWVSWTKSF